MKRKPDPLVVLAVVVVVGMLSSSLFSGSRTTVKQVVDSKAKISTTHSINR